MEADRCRLGAVGNGDFMFVVSLCLLEWFIFLPWWIKNVVLFHSSAAYWSRRIFEVDSNNTVMYFSFDWHAVVLNFFLIVGSEVNDCHLVHLLLWNNSFLNVFCCKFMFQFGILGQFLAGTLFLLQTRNNNQVFIFFLIQTFKHLLYD